MPSKDKLQTNRDRKKNRKNSFDINGKYSAKHIRQKESLLEKQRNTSKDSQNNGKKDEKKGNKN